jgi:undecaprenyl phosphate-alpha-L-ara4N flippase subunit ArnE
VNAIVLIVATLLLAAGQVLQKLVASRYVDTSTRHLALRRMLFSRELIAALSCLGLGMIAWLVVLYRTDVSRAFPILSFGSVLVLAASQLYLKEPVSGRRWAGALLVTLGVILVSAS